jgi:uncharacterized protein (TIGR00251 family)
MTQQSQPAVTIKVRVQPRASKDEILGYRGSALRVRVTAPPDGGRANEAVIALLAGALGVAKSRINIVRGMASREKVVMIESLTQEEVQRRLDVVAS